MTAMRATAASLALILTLLAGMAAGAEVKRWEGLIDADEGRGLAGHGDFALACNRRDGLFVLVPLETPPSDPASLTFVVDGNAFVLAHVSVYEEEGRPVLVAPLGREDPAFTTLRRGLEFHILTGRKKTEIGLYGAAPLLRDMLKACFG